MRLAKLCITLALVTGGWHTALASALCARDADCHASASPRASHAGRETPRHAAAHAAAERREAATPAAAAQTDDPKNHHGHCAASAESPRAVAHAATPDAGHEAAHGDDENAAPANVADPSSPGSSCGHCVGRQTGQPARVKSSAPAFARDVHAAHAFVQHLVTLPRPAPRARYAPPEHSPPRGRPLHLLNSALLI